MSRLLSYTIDEIAGKRFNGLTVIGDKFIVTKRNSHVLCRCDCGTEKLMRVDQIINGRNKHCSRDCPCKPDNKIKQQIKSLVGKTIGNFTILNDQIIYSNNYYNPQVLCRCSCGNEKYVYTDRLLNNPLTNNCGECYHGIAAKEFTGKRYGKLTVIGNKYIKDVNGGKYILCRCDCGNERLIMVSPLSRNKHSSCAFCDQQE